MKEVFIISTGQIVNGKIAGAQRVGNIAKSLAAGDVSVCLCSVPQVTGISIEIIGFSEGISFLQGQGNGRKNLFQMFKALTAIRKYIEKRSSDKVIYLYPTTFIVWDFVYLLYFKIIHGYKLFCDINELRATKLVSFSSADGLLSKLVFPLRFIYDVVIYRLNEKQIPFYDGIVVISTNLEKYFSKSAKKIIRIPILCDTTRIEGDRPAIKLGDTIFKICFAGSLDWEKEGFDILFKSLAQVNLKHPAELYLYGDMPAWVLRKINQLTGEYSLEGKVVYLGNIDPESLIHEFQKYHLLILPRPLTRQSKYGFSTKLSEYLISGIPTLVTDVSDNALYIRDNYNGYMITPGSISLMTDKILEIIESYDNNASDIAWNALQTAREKLDYRLYSKAFIDFFYNN